MTLQIEPDPGIEALGILSKAAVNAKLEPVIGEPAIRHTFGVQFPTSLLGAEVLPCLCIYRFRDQDRVKGDTLFEETTTFRFDYLLPATTADHIDKRWPLLRQVWITMLGALRVGRHPDVANEENLLQRGGLFRYVLGSGRVDYGVIDNRGTVYPSFRGQMQFEGAYPTPESFYDDVDKNLRLSNFGGLDVKWDLRPETNQEFEAQDRIDLEQE